QGVMIENPEPVLGMAPEVGVIQRLVGEAKVPATKPEDHGKLLPADGPLFVEPRLKRGGLRRSRFADSRHAGFPLERQKEGDGTTLSRADCNWPGPGSSWKQVLPGPVVHYI